MPEEEESWKDTNVGNIGSDADKAARKSAAGGEPAWEGIGLKGGLSVFRIENFIVTPVDVGDYGKFHKGDSYITLQTIEGEGGVCTHNIYFYLGSETSIDERGTAAYKTVELDDFFDGEPTQHREVMGEESDAFKALFEGGITVLEGGVDSGFKHVVPNEWDPRLWVVRTVKGKVESVRLPLTTKSLVEGDCFVLSAEKAIYILEGPKCEPMEKVAANKLAEEREGVRGGKIQATHDIDEAFWAVLTGEKPAWAARARGASSGAYLTPAVKAAEVAGSIFPLEELKNGCPAGVDAAHKQNHLNDADFQIAFGMAKGDFEKLPGWKQNDAKKKAGLF